MRYVAAYLLAVLGGNAAPSSDDIVNILSSVGIEAEDDKLSKVISELKGKSINELMEQGMEKLSTMPVGGGVAVAAAPGGAAAAAVAEPAAAAKKEEKKEEPKEEESDEDLGFGLFD